jgi:hypothetical protein
VGNRDRIDDWIDKNITVASVSQGGGRSQAVLKDENSLGKIPVTGTQKPPHSHSGASVQL